MKQMEMNKQKNAIYGLSTVLVFLFTLSGLSLCSSVGSRGAVGGLNYSPGGNGFAYKAVAVPRGDFNKWAKANRDKIKKTIDSMDEGFVLEAVGHTDSSGPRNAASGGRKGNVWYSTQRARAVYSALLRQGFKRSRLRYKGIADDELLDSSEPRGQINRRVSFRVVSK